MSTGRPHSGKTGWLFRLRHFFFIFVYLWLLLSVYTLHNTLVLSDWSLLAHLGAATLKALVFAKFILIGEHLKLGSRAEHLPLIWPILIKSALFSLVLIGFNLAEEALLHWLRPHEAASGDGMDLGSLPAILSLTVMIFVALIPFFGIRELGRIIGEDGMFDLFFRKGPRGANTLGPGAD
ncbi:MAG: hypothetical protein Q7V31_12300 [Parvibaculum sp.]|uniref:hypothetical protein n=1 Tax=Parvibaculum sp. TaxID=2024848 RepID=UPI00271AE1E3|nr:hypothetical protein [Parvibaculum sp.]MDO8839699.1 hypothetical protein [Parvibaculum sp.]